MSVEERVANVEQELATLSGHVTQLIDDRTTDKAAAKKDADNRQGEIVGLIKENNAELKRINGSIQDHEKRLYGMERVDADRVRVNTTSGELLLNPASRRVSGKQVAQVVGYSGLGTGLLWLLVKLSELQEVLAQIGGS